MKRQHPAGIKKETVRIPVQSPEITLLSIGQIPSLMKGYYLERIEELQANLKQLNLLDNTCQITRLCHEIIRVQKAVDNLNIQ
jgi:hypothetical protein